MEHNFMMSPEGMTNFSNQVKQLVGSIQMSNDLDFEFTPSAAFSARLGAGVQFIESNPLDLLL
jgi:hypothetical protein